VHKSEVVGNGLAPFRLYNSRKESSPFPPKDHETGVDPTGVHECEVVGNGLAPFHLYVSRVEPGASIRKRNYPPKS